MNFKTILNECNSTESKQQALFEKVYFECNIEPLFEQVLREAGIDSIQPACPPNPTNNSPQQRNPQEKPENGKEQPKKLQSASIIKDPNLGQNIDILI